LEVLTQYPSWFIILCVASGLIFSSALYVKDKLTADLHISIKILVAILRFLAITVLAFFLLEPLIKYAFIETEKPIVVIAQDNSESIKLKTDTTFLNGTYKKDILNLESSLAEKFEVVHLAFGAEVKDSKELTYSEKNTDYSQLLEEINSRYSNRNLGAVILSTDGIFTKGKNPVYSQKKLNVPVYTIALGDTTRFKDLLIEEVAHNRLAYLGNKFPLEIVVAANELNSRSTRLSITHKGREVYSEPISIDTDDFLRISPAILEAKSPGLQKYSISLSAVEGEETITNNRTDIYIDILDSRQKVALITANPHPDIAALKSSIESNENYELEVINAADFNGSVKDYNLFIFHQMPSKGITGNNIISNAFSEQIPALFIWGTETDYDTFNSLDLGVALTKSTDQSDAVSGSLNSGFQVYKTEESFSSIIRKFPPLAAPFGKLESSPGLKTHLNKKIGPVVTNEPLFTFNEKNDVKFGVLTAEGIWRWRLFTHLETGSHEAFDKWFLKSIQYLANKADKSLFRVSGKSNLDETQRILFNAEVYNESLEPLSDQEINLTVTDEKGNEYNYTFTQNGEAYRLDIGLLPSGNYSYVSEVTAAGKLLTKSGQFSVSSVLVEQLRTEADHTLLFNLSESTGGKLIAKENVSSLTEIISNNGEITAVDYEKKTLTDLINYHWLMYLLLGLLCLEWLLRKRNGVY